MPKHDKIETSEVRSALDSAFTKMRSGDPSSAVRTLGEAYLNLLAQKPELLRRRGPGGRRQRMLPAALRWPSLGANLNFESLRAGKPTLEYRRERFALSEALTYYEFLVELALLSERPTRADENLDREEPEA